MTHDSERIVREYNERQETTRLGHYARILVEDGKPFLRVASDEGILHDVPLAAANLFRLMKEGMSALVTMAQNGTLVGLLEEDKPS